MKVLMIDQWLPQQPYTQELARELSRHVELTLAAPRYYRPQGERFRCRSVLETKVKEKKLGMLSYLRGVLWLYTAALFGRYEVLHVQVFKKPRMEMPAFRLARRLTKKKLVYTAHNILPHEHGGSRREAEDLRRWYRLCDAILVHNEHSRKVLLDFEPSVADRVHVISHGTFDDYAGAVKELPHEKTVFLQFGMIRKYKGIDALLRAAAKLPDELRKQIRIVIAGNQRPELDDTDYRAMIVELGVGDFVTFTPRRIPDEELPAYFNGCDCCLFPYTNIYGSGALLLAYTFRKPVIASGIPTFVEETDGGKTGLLYDPADENGLAEAIERFVSLSEEEKASMRRNTQEICRTKYSWAVSAEKLATLYRSLV